MTERPVVALQGGTEAVEEFVGGLQARDRRLGRRRLQ